MPKTLVPDSVQHLFEIDEVTVELSTMLQICFSQDAAFEDLSLSQPCHLHGPERVHVWVTQLVFVTEKLSAKRPNIQFTKHMHRTSKEGN